MPTIYTHRDSNIRKTWTLFTVFLIVIIGVGYLFSYVYESPEILVVAVVFSVFMSFTSYWQSDKIVLRMANAKPISKESHRELYNLVENLSITAGLPMPRVYVVHETAPNAFATGRDPKHATVAVTSGLLDKLNKTELEGVLAHELSHIGNRDILVSTVAVVLVGFIAILSDVFIRSTMFSGRRKSSDNRAGMIMLLIGIAFSILAPVSVKLLQLAISRKREFLADASGVLLTRYPEGLASALKKISQDQTPMSVAKNSTSHLWIDNPFKGKKRESFFQRILSTHPPIEARIKALLGEVARG